jgi:hypothetical protein
MAFLHFNKNVWILEKYQAPPSIKKLMIFFSFDFCHLKKSAENTCYRKKRANCEK